MLAIQLVQGVFVASLGASFTYSGIYLLREGTLAHLGTALLLGVALLMALELGIALYIILRKKRIIDLTQTARRAINTGQTDIARHALIQLLNFIEYRLNAARIYYGLAVADVLDGDTDRALVLLKKAGHLPAAIELRVLLLLSQGLAEKGARLMTAAIASSPRNQRYWVTLAACQQAMGETRTAIKLLESGMKLWPRSFGIQSALKMLNDGESLANAVLAYGLRGKGSARMEPVPQPPVSTDDNQPAT